MLSDSTRYYLLFKCQSCVVYDSKSREHKTFLSLFKSRIYMWFGARTHPFQMFRSLPVSLSHTLSFSLTLIRKSANEINCLYRLLPGLSILLILYAAWNGILPFHSTIFPGRDLLPKIGRSPKLNLTLEFLCQDDVSRNVREQPQQLEQPMRDGKP